IRNSDYRSIEALRITQALLTYEVRPQALCRCILRQGTAGEVLQCCGVVGGVRTHIAMLQPESIYHLLISASCEALREHLAVMALINGQTTTPVAVLVVAR